MADVMISIDLGTTRLKVAAFSPDGTLHHQLSCRHRDYHDEGRRWQNADDWWADTSRLIRDLLAHLQTQKTLRPVSVLGISLSGRGGAAVFADAGGQVLVHPWSDDRHGEELRALRSRQQDGSLSMYAAAMLAKIRWLQAHAPETAARTRLAFYGKDFLLYRLTGEHLTDYASGPDGPMWNAQSLLELSVDAELLPDPRLPWTLAGGLQADAARSLGLPAGTPVAVGAHDGISANIGAGAARAGDVALTLGTHAVVRAVSAHLPPGANRFYGLPPDGHVLGANTWFGGRAADWILDLTSFPAAQDDASRAALFSAMDDAAASVPVGSRGVLFLPYLAGQVSPERRPDAQGVLSGLSLTHDAPTVYRAVLEGCSCAIAENFELVTRWCNRPARVRMTGSGARSAPWLQMLAALLQVPLEVSDTAVEGRGAVICLAVALGLMPDVQHAGDRMVPVTGRIEATAEQMDAYAEVKGRWAVLQQLHHGES